MEEKIKVEYERNYNLRDTIEKRIINEIRQGKQPAQQDIDSVRIITAILQTLDILLK